MPITATIQFSNGPNDPWTVRGFWITNPSQGGRFSLFISCRQSASGNLAVNAYVNEPGSNSTTAAATARCLGMSDWDEPVLTLLDIVKYWGTQSFRAADDPLPPQLEEAVREFCIGNLSPAEFRSAVEAEA